MLNIAVFLCVVYMLVLASIMKVKNFISWVLFKGIPIFLALSAFYLHFLNGKVIQF